ncbi:S-layer homology domain-containing protein [Intestinimonas massiliensis (ex Afouda et al. 2020)]|uniref:S-layer homology domain-containing protein n=1 Tax=Intestinimonas massiliensis (ex Afouda et al. 2020) TaxID=1673721 RepID=UPI001030CA5B|nr:S-layer homology domain-containing protein [Intestinimonas massiliensis (ex Afouda et al. 2020)]
MKGKRFLAWAMTVVLTISLLTVTAGAVTFSDMTNHWAKTDVEYLATQGVINGTSATTFTPDRAMTACEAVIFCSRATGVSATDKTKISQKWAATLKEIMPESLYSWAGEEMAVCLETGIISETELRSLSQSGGLVKAISRETLAMYLVRAMQLEPLAKSLTSYPLSFADATSISAALQPYVYVLYSYGIVEGNQYNQFLPSRSLTRAEMAVMLRRTMDFMEERGLYAELPAYTDYAWTGGTIAAVTSGGSGTTLLTLNSDITGTTSISLPSDVKIYENNMLSGTSALRVGQYARVNLSKSGTAQSVRLGGTLTAFSGTVNSITRDRVNLLANGTTRSLAIDRFTAVQVGGTAGGAELIDLQAGYTTAQCYVDSMGHLAGLKLSGGSHSAEGILVSVVEASSGQSLQVSSFNGETQRYTLPVGAGVTVNGVVGSLSTAHVGDYVSMRVSNDSGNQLVSLSVDTVTQYIQGVVNNYTYAKDVNTITISKVGSSSYTTYNIAANAVVRYNGAEIALKNLEKGSYATVRLSGGQAAEIDAWPGSTTTEGVVESIAFGTPTTLSVRTADGGVVTFEIDLTNLPTVYRDGKSSTIDKIRSGDSIIVTVRYHQVNRLETTSQSANVTGTITRVVQDTSGVTIDVQLAGGSTTSYTVAEGVTVTQNGSIVSLYSLKPNDKVAMVVSGDEVISIEVAKGSGSNTQLTGKVLLTNSSAKTLMIQPDNGNTLTIDVSDASFVTASGGSTSLGGLKAGDSVQIYGSYSGGEFVATLVVKMA